jgi:hypothetical protein
VKALVDARAAMVNFEREGNYMRPLLGIAALSIFFGPIQSRAADPKQPNSEGASTIATVAGEPNTELLLRLGNESNPVDGILGPFTYGGRGAHKFENGWATELGYIRLHEPGSPNFTSVLDEAQLTLKAPASQLDGRPLKFDGTIWKNRLIDMYTEVGGLEVTWAGALSLNLGVFLGRAVRDDENKRFIGGQLGVSASIGPVELSAGFAGGKIGTEGSYRRVALEGSSQITGGKLPLVLTFGIEERNFRFGGDGPASNPHDEFIYVTGIEIHFERLVF